MGQQQSPTIQVTDDISRGRFHIEAMSGPSLSGLPPLFLCLESFMGGTALQLDLSCQYIFRHHEIPKQTVKRIVKRRGPVLLEEEMADPRETVTAEEHSQKRFPVKGENKKEETREREYRAREV